MENMGVVFKKFRERKGLSVKETSEGIVSPQFLRKYEAAKSDISFSNLIQLLFRLNVTLDEFLAEADFTAMDHWLSRMEDIIDNYAHGNNSLGLTKFIEKQQLQYQQTQDLKFYYMQVVAEVVYNRFFQTIYQPDTASVLKYLQRVEEWGRFEFFLCIYSDFPLAADFLLVNTRTVIKKIDIQHTNYYYMNDFLVHVIIHFVRLDQLALAEELVKMYKEHVFIQDSVRYLPFDVYVAFIEGSLRFLKGDQHGEVLCEKIIEFYSEVIGHRGYASLLHRQFLRLKNKSS